MSRIRSVHPGFFTDEDLVAVSLGARLLFIGLGVEADDKGVFVWKPLTIKMRVFPADNVDVAEMLAELVGIGAVRQFEAEGKTYGAIRNFRKFQKPKTPNDIHPCGPDILLFVGLTPAVSETDEDDEPPFPPKGEISPQMEDGGGKMEGEEDSPPSGGGEVEPDDPLRPEHVRDEWNKLAPKISKPRVRDLTPARRELLKARIAQYDIDDFLAVFGAIERSPFLRGDTGWRGMGFDWVFKRANFQKILEGNYDG